MCHLLWWAFEWLLAAVCNLNADFKFQCWKRTNLFFHFLLFLATFLYERSSLWTCRINPWSSAWVQHYSLCCTVSGFSILWPSFDCRHHPSLHWYCSFCSWHWFMLLSLLPYKCMHKAFLVPPPHCHDSRPTSTRRIWSLSESFCSSALSNTKQVNITKLLFS